jgi:hypothetical protein
MNMVRGDYIVEYRKTEAFLGFEDPVKVAASVLSITDGSSLAFFSETA